MGANLENKDPVILKLEGGLGNQLFQLAAGYLLAARLETELKLDQYSIPFTTVHGETIYGFEPFEIPELPHSRNIIIMKGSPHVSIVRLAKKSRVMRKILMKIRMFSSNQYNLDLFLEANDETSIADFYAINVPVKLHGNFQSWDIVERAAEFGFPRVFRLRSAPKWIVELENEIDFKNSIVLHFRVGDDTRTNINFKQPDIVYYLEAVKILKSRMKVSSTYILSDDIIRVKEMFGDKFGSDFQYLEMPNRSSPAERLYVLSLFGGIVCANSTFCGWAAWSIYNSGGAVVVPVPYSDGRVLGSRDFPPKWIQLNKYLGVEVS